MRVDVRHNNIEDALKVLKNKLQKDGLLKILKNKRYYTKPSDAKRIQKAEAIARAKKENLKRMERDGF